MYESASTALSASSSLPQPQRKRQWHACWCVLRGSTIFYFRVTSVDAAATRRAGEDHVVDLRRVVGDDDDASYSLKTETATAATATEKEKDSDSPTELTELTSPIPGTLKSFGDVVEAVESFGERPQLELGKDGEDDVLELRVRRDNGGVYTVYLKKPAVLNVENPAQIEATAWDDEARAALEDSAGTTLREWRDAVVHVIAKDRARTRDEIKHMMHDYRRTQERGVENAKKFGGDDPQAALSATLAKTAAAMVAEAAASSRRGPLSSCVPQPPSPLTRIRDSPLNGCWELERRGSQLDSLLASEGISFGARINASAAPASIYINLADANHCVVYNKDGFLPNRFVGPLDKASQMLVVADDASSPVCLAITSLSPDGRTLVMAQASTNNGHVFCQSELRIAPHSNDVLEQRFKYFHILGDPDVTTHGILFTEGGQHDLFRRMPPDSDRATKLELGAM